MASTANRDADKQAGEGGSSKKTDSEDDLCLLLDCLQYQQHCVSAQKQALTTIATMCSNSNTARNLFNTTGGLSYVLDLLFNSKSFEVQQAALYTLGCASENNMVNQLKLCHERLFSFLANLLTPEAPPKRPVPDTFVMAVAFLSGCLMSNNVQGQKLAKDSGLLAKLISVFRSALPLPTSLKPEQVDGASAVALKQNMKHQYRMWSSISSALCTATNNPQNELNQCQCIKLFPAALSMLDIIPFNVNIVRPAISLLASCTANNKAAQDRLRMVGGLKALVNALCTVVQSLTNGQESELPLHIVKTLSVAAFGHSVNCKTLVELDCTDLLLCLLHYPSLDESTKLNVILCLGMLTEDNQESQQRVAKSVRLLVDVMANSQCEELSKATAFVLQCCIEKSKQGQLSPEGNAFAEKIAHIDKLLSKGEELNSSPDSSAGIKSITTEALEMLATRKLPAKDLVSAWLDNHVPNDSPSHSEEQSEGRAVQQKTKHHDPGEEKSVLTQGAESQALVELQREKELRGRLETMLKSEREIREKLEQELKKEKEMLTKREEKELQDAQSEKEMLTKQKERELQAAQKEKELLEKKKEMELQAAKKESDKRKALAKQREKELLAKKKLISNRKPIANTPQAVYCKHHTAVNAGTPMPEATASSRTNIRYASSMRPVIKALQRLSKPMSEPPNIHASPLVCPHSKEDNSYDSTIYSTSAARSTDKLHKPNSTHQLTHSVNTHSKPYEHYCLGCKPRLKCPLINSRNFIRMLQVDRHTCSYHRRIAFKLKGEDATTAKSYIYPHSSHLDHTFTPIATASTQIGGTFNTQPSGLSEPSTLRTLADDTLDNDSPEFGTPTISPQNDKESPPQESTTPTSEENSSDPDYVPKNTSSSEENSSTNATVTGVEEKSSSPTFQTGGAAQVHKNPKPFVKNYKLLPNTCGPRQGAKKFQRKPFSNITNKKVPIKEETHRKSLAVFDYATPPEKSKYLPGRQSSLTPERKVQRKRAPAVPWSKQEERFLKEGVQLLGLGQWRHILAAYSFHSSRDCSSLRVKYRNMCQRN